MNNWQGAIVYLTPKLGGDTIVDSAAHVFITTDGFVYVNPGYIYPETAHLNNFHRIEAKLSAMIEGDNGGRVNFYGAEFSGHIEEWTAELAQLEDAGDALHYYENELEARKTNYFEERARVLAILVGDLR